MKSTDVTAWVRQRSFSALITFIVVCGTGCHKADRADTTSDETGPANTNVALGEPTNPSSSTQALAASISNAPGLPGTPVPGVTDGRFQIPLPDFTTHLVNLSSAAVSANVAPDLTKLCALLKQQTSIPEINSIMECRVRSDNPLLAKESPAKSIVSFYLHNTDLQAEKLSIEGWSNLKPPQGDLGVIDFKSPQNTFERFRVVTFPAERAEQPLRLPASFLQVNQSGLLASFEKAFAVRIARLMPHEGFLQLRPFLRSESGARDLIEALPLPYQAMTTNGNELNFTRLRGLISNAQGEKTRRLREIERPLGLYSDSFNRSYLPPRMQKELAEAQQAKALLEASIEMDRACLAMIPEQLLDPRLDHVALFFVTRDSGGAWRRIELIRFEALAAALEVGK